MMLKRVLVTGISAQFADCEGIVRVIIVEATVADRVLCILLTTMKIHGFSRWLSGKKSTCNAGDASLIPGPGRFPGEGNGYPLQYSCLENSMDRGAWQALYLYLYIYIYQPGV